MAKCENECYKLIRALPIVAENWMRKPLVIQLALLLIAAAIFVLGSPLDASAGKKCITIGDKRICFEDGKDKSNDDADNAKSQKTCAKKRFPARPATWCSTSPTSTVPVASRRKGCLPLR